MTRQRTRGCILYQDLELQSEEVKAELKENWDTFHKEFELYSKLKASSTWHFQKSYKTNKPATPQKSGKDKV